MDKNANNDMFEEIDPSDVGKVDETLAKYKLALEQEFAETSNGTNLREVSRKTKEQLVSLVPEALTSMRGLAIGAESESVRFGASKWILENVLLPNKAGSRDTLADLLEEMEEQTSNTKTESST